MPQEDGAAPGEGPALSDASLQAPSTPLAKGSTPRLEVGCTCARHLQPGRMWVGDPAAERWRPTVGACASFEGRFDGGKHMVCSSHDQPTCWWPSSDRCLAQLAPRSSLSQKDAGQAAASGGVPKSSGLSAQLAACLMLLIDTALRMAAAATEVGRRWAAGLTEQAWGA